MIGTYLPMFLMIAVAVILAGLYFREIVSAQAPSSAVPDKDERRSRMFSACSLVGPFAEAATGCRQVSGE